jgi:hypothetical protein
VDCWGDRAYALRDTSDGKIATAKNPRKWPNLFEYRRADWHCPHPAPRCRPRACHTAGEAALSAQNSPMPLESWTTLNREVRLEKIAGGQQEAAPANKETSEESWLDMEGSEQRDTVTDFTLPEGTFFDTAYIHMLTTATLEHLRALYPHGRRFLGTGTTSGRAQQPAHYRIHDRSARFHIRLRELYRRESRLASARRAVSAAGADDCRLDGDGAASNARAPVCRKRS